MRYHSPLVTVLLLCAGVPLFAQGASRAGRAPIPLQVISGVVRDSATGAPLVAATIDIGRTDSTDSKGRFTFVQVPAGEIGFSLRCPTRTWQGKLLLFRKMRIVPGSDVTMELRVDTSLCNEPAPRAVRGEFRGYYRSGFEESEFSPCADSALGVPMGEHAQNGWTGTLAWVGFNASSEASLAAARKAFRARHRDDDGVYVRWIGTLEGPGRYGRGPASSYLFRVDSVAYMGPMNGDACVNSPENAERSGSKP